MGTARENSKTRAAAVHRSRRNIALLCGMMAALPLWAVAPLDLPLPQEQLTLRGATPAAMEWARHEQLLGRGDLTGWSLTSGQFQNGALVYPLDGWVQTATGDNFLQVRPLAGYEWRQLGDNWGTAAIRSGGELAPLHRNPKDTTGRAVAANAPAGGDQVGAFEMGAEISGRLGQLQWMVDGRIYTEDRTSSDRYSYDRGFIEVQNEGELSNFTFVSYARYRAAMSYSGQWGTLGYRHDALQWGPGLYHNLVQHGSAIPFNQFYYQGSVGPVRVMSLWGELAIDGGASFRKSDKSRQLFAHRYEWNVTPSLLLGLSEQLILYDGSAPAALIPIVPLFMEKGQGVEANNNGNLAVDLSWRLPLPQPWGALLYGEFLVDDLQEPSSLFDNFWGNRWGALVGGHLARDLRQMQLGVVGEFVQIEPWVYTHYHPATAQSTHRGDPIGNPLGPNSRAATLKLYARSHFSWSSALRCDWIWRGEEPGSSVDDPVRLFRPKTKERLAGADSPQVALSPSVAYQRGPVTVEATATLRGKNDADWQQRILVRF